MGFASRSYDALRGSPLLLKLIPAACIITFAAWGVGPLMRWGRVLFLHVLILVYNLFIEQTFDQPDYSWKFCCRSQMAVGRKVVHTTLRLLTFSLY